MKAQCTEAEWDIYSSMTYITIGSDYGSFLDGTKPLHEPMLASH